MSGKSEGHDGDFAAAAVFATTHWSTVLTAGRQDSPRAEIPLERLCRTYWYPVYAYVRRQGHNSVSRPGPARTPTPGWHRVRPRGLVRLTNASSAGQPQRFPRQAEGIPVHQLCHRLHFLHAADTSDAEGAQIGSYVVRGADGARLEIPILYGRDVLAWNVDPPHTHSPPVVAWKGRNCLQVPVRLFLTSWENPRPDVRVETIDFLSSNAKAAPFLVAITAEP
jgi:hypothetical protein